MNKIDKNIDENIKFRENFIDFFKVYIENTHFEKEKKDIMFGKNQWKVKNKNFNVGLDVIDGEWLTNKKLLQHKLIRYSKNNKNLLIVPHIGGSTSESIYGARVFMIKKLYAKLPIGGGTCQSPYAI